MTLKSAALPKVALFGDEAWCSAHQKIWESDGT
jgi:hypothetical protein